MGERFCQSKTLSLSGGFIEYDSNYGCLRGANIITQRAGSDKQNLWKRGNRHGEAFSRLSYNDKLWGEPVAPAVTHCSPA